MSNANHCLDYNDIPVLNKLVLDYINNHPRLSPYFNVHPSSDNFAKVVQYKQAQPINREALHQVITSQYQGISISPVVSKNIELLLSPTTFTICTAHQPNVFTGYLYFIYKIIHACKLAQELQKNDSLHNFVPIYYIGSEDADIDEIGHINLNGKSYNWKPEASGAVGRMPTTSIQYFLQEILKQINTYSNYGKHLYEILKTAYSTQKNIAQATRYIVNEILGEYGVVVVDGDDPMLKKQFIPIIIDELKNKKSYELVEATKKELRANYKLQANARPINLFYLDDGIRERIEYSKGFYKVLNTSIQFTEQQILELAHTSPEKFSPNVILRALYQEIILPNIAFIGGGGEIAYWLELKKVFDTYTIPFPILILRQSFLWLSEKQNKKLNRLKINFTEIFKPLEDILLTEAKKNTAFDTSGYDKLHQELFEEIKKVTQQLSLPIQESLEAHFTKSKKIQSNISEKIIRELKKQNVEFNEAAKKLKQELFPNGNLQERTLNFIPFYTESGPAFIEKIYNGIDLHTNQFIIGTV